jgi:uncharacterized membrane protein YeaQ/YmgE (transglycosylase-associated protein family)
MSIIGWLILGLIAGFIASKVVNKSGEGLLLDIILGIVGAVVGGFLFSLIGAAPVTGLNIYSMVVAVIGAIVMLLVYDAIVSRRRIESLSVRTLACSRLTVDQMLSSIVTLPPLLQTGALALPKC